MSNTILHYLRPIGMSTNEPVSPAAAAAAATAAAAARSLTFQHMTHNKQIHQTAQHSPLTTSLFFRQLRHHSLNLSGPKSNQDGSTTRT